MWCESYAVVKIRRSVDNTWSLDDMPFCERTEGHNLPHRGDGWVWDDDSIRKEESDVPQAQHSASAE